MPTQSKIGWRPYVNPSITASSLWNSIYSVYNADAIGSTSLNTSLFSAYNGESNTNDSKGTNNGTAVGGLTYTTGKIGNAFQFNGTNAYVSLPNSSGQFNFTGDFSVSCWFKTSTVSGNQIIFSNLAYNGGVRKGFYIILSSNTIGCWLINQPTYVQEFYTSAAVSINTWYHLSVTRGSGVVKIYLNGTLLATDTNGIPLSYVTTLTSIGAYTHGAPSPITSYFNGSIDAFNIWQKALTQSEITELYNSGNGAQYITDSFYKPTTNDALLVNNGTAQGGLTYGLGKVGTAFQFNGTNTYVSFPTGAFHSLTTDFSVSAWVSIPAGYTTQIPIFSNISSTSWFSNVGGFWLTLFGYGIQFRIGDKTVGPHDTTTTILTGTITAPPSNTFVHIVATRKAGQRSRIYYNGTLIANNTDARNPAYYTSGVNTTTPTIGNIKIPNGVQDAYYAPNGTKIDGLSVWSKELTQADVTELYNSGNGKQYVSSLDSDAQAFIASAAITVTTQQTAINTLVTDLKAANIWTKMKAIYPFVGGTATQHRFNLKSPGTTAADFYLDFIGGSIHSATGYLLNGVSAYSDTKLNTKNILTPNNLSIGFYTNTNRAAAASRNSYGNADNGGYTPITQFYLRTSSDQLVSDLGDYNYGRVSGANTTTSGMYINTRTASNSMKVFKNGSLFGSSTQNNPTNTLPNCNLPIGAFSLSGAMSGYESINYQFFYVSDGLTDAEALAFYTAVQKYQTTLGRQV